jgi:hypothetical protein
MLGVREGIVESLGVEGCFENTYFLFPGLEVERRFGLPISLITSSGGERTLKLAWTMNRRGRTRR